MVISTLDTDFISVSEKKDYYVELQTNDLLSYRKGENWMMTKERYVLKEDVDTR